MEIKVLGTGCPRCKKVEELVRAALADLGAEAKLTKVTNMADILQYQIMATPGLVIDEKVYCYGRIPSPVEVTSFITTALSRQEG